MPSSPEPYVAVALQPSFRAVMHRRDIKQNIDSISVLMNAAVWLSAEFPVRLVALPEGVLQSFNDEILDRAQSDYLEHVAIDIPGPETDALGELARKFKTYLVGQAKATDPRIPGYFFNVAFVIDPDGEVIHRAAKNIVACIEGSCTPHDVYDRWVQVYGDGLDSFFPVVDTPIGRLGTMICYEGMFPETARGLAMNGAEIIYHPSAAVNTVDMGTWELVNRSRASDNNCYVVAPNTGLYHIAPESHDGIDVTGGHSMIVDYRGKVIACHDANTSSWAAAVIDVAGLRHFRRHATMRNWMRELRTEIFRPIYTTPIYEKNLYLGGSDQDRAARIAWGRTGADRVLRAGARRASAATRRAQSADAGRPAHPAPPARAASAPRGDARTRRGATSARRGPSTSGKRNPSGRTGKRSR
jgi:predicted amidohydrolase